MLIRICMLCVSKVLCALYLYYHLSKDVAHLRTVVKWIGIIRNCSVSVDMLFSSTGYTDSRLVIRMGNRMKTVAENKANEE